MIIKEEILRLGDAFVLKLLKKELDTLEAENANLKKALLAIAQLDINCTHARWKSLAHAALEKKP